MSRQDTMETRVKAVLAKDKESRNDDIRLTQVYWWTYHRALMKTINGKPVVPLVDLHKLTPEDGLTRVRRKIQNEQHLYLPTRKSVGIKRLGSETEWRNYLGYPTGDTL